MRNVIVALQVLVPLALVFGIYTATMRDQGHLVQRVNRDDWRGVRDAATRIIERDSRWIPDAVRWQAIKLVGVAHLVLGELPEARAALERALAADLPAPLCASAERQLASVERCMGDFEAARARLVAPSASSSDDDRWAVGAQLAQALLDAGDPAAAEQAILPVVAELERWHGTIHTSVMRGAVGADLAQARCVLVRALIDQAKVDRAGEAYATVVSAEDRPYLHGQISETGARLALLRGDPTAATDAAEVAWRLYGQVGARLDLARVDVLRARIDRDVVALDAAEAELRALGALGHLREVDEARLEIDGLG